MKRAMGTPWSTQTTDVGEFDEIVVSEWLHVERMSPTHYWLRIGERSFDVFARGKDGTVDVREQ